MDELEHECPDCHKVYPCPDPPERRGCQGERKMRCTECNQRIAAEYDKAEAADLKPCYDTG